MKKSIKSLATKAIVKTTTVKGGHRRDTACEASWGVDDVSVYEL